MWNEIVEKAAVIKSNKKIFGLNKMDKDKKMLLFTKM